MTEVSGTNTEYSPANKALAQKRIHKCLKKIKAYKLVEKQVRLDRESCEIELLAQTKILADYKSQKQGKESNTEEKKEVLQAPEVAPVELEGDRQKFISDKGIDLKYSDLKTFKEWTSQELINIFTKFYITNTSHPSEVSYWHMNFNPVIKFRAMLKDMACKKCSRLAHGTSQHNMWHIEKCGNWMNSSDLDALMAPTLEELTKIFKVFHTDADSVFGTMKHNSNSLWKLLKDRACPKCDQLSHRWKRLPTCDLPHTVTPVLKRATSMDMFRLLRVLRKSDFDEYDFTRSELEGLWVNHFKTQHLCNLDPTLTDDQARLYMKSLIEKEEARRTDNK